ncbi:MAG: ATP-binding cassette domain-containing protein [Pontibacterium sp.]
MIQLDNVSLQRGNNSILENANLRIHASWKVGLVGVNGAGKSTLLKLLLRELQIDSGDISMPPLDVIAHMAQEVNASERTALDYVLDGDAKLQQLQQQIADAQVAGDHDTEAKCHSELDAIDGYTAPTRAEQLLAGLGFKASDIHKPVSDFSGGWRIRLNLAQALMCRSELLLLDEPTNHLDMDACFWLEQWLRSYPGTIIVISHDRDFLDQVVSHIACMTQQKIDFYKGNYSSFERQRAERLMQQQAAFEKQQAKIAHIEDFVRRFRAKASKAKQAQSRLKELERMEALAPAHVHNPFSFEFKSTASLSNPLIALNHANCGYAGSAPTLSDVSVHLGPGSRIGLLGPNGAGKSTLIKSMVGDLALQSGEKVDSENLRIGYFAQHQLEALDLNASPVLHIKRLSPDTPELEVRKFLGGFGFIGDQALDEVKRFSGGEKARLALALLAWQKPNLLLMDEPTNHLDLEVRHALTMALQTFEGAMVVVSHDRHLLRNCVDNFWLVNNGSVSEFDGDLEAYHQWLSDHMRAQTQAQAPTNTAPKGQTAADRKEQKRLEAERRKKLAPLKKQLTQLEQALDKATEALAEIETQLADNSLYDDSNKDKLKQLLAEQARLTQESEQTEEAWMEAQEALEALEADLT